MITQSPIRFGFIGAGKIAASSAKSVNNHPAGKVVAVQDLSKARAEELCTEFNVPHYHETAAELFANPEVDAVYIAVPNKFHAPLAIEALNAGKHVMLEKPFAMNAIEAAEVIAAAEKAGRVLTLGMNQRFISSAQMIRDLVVKGELGDIYHAKAHWFRRSGIPKLGTWFGTKSLSGGGAINDIGVHALDLCLHLMGNFDAVSVSGATYTQFGHRGLGEGGWGHSDRENLPFDVDDFSTALIRFSNGATVTLDAAWACHQPASSRFSVELYGSSGGASLDPLRFCHPGEENEYVVEDKLDRPLALPHADRFHNLINHLTEGEELLVKPAEALMVQKILDAVSESARTGKDVTLN